MENVVVYIFVVFAGFGGLLLSLYIHHKKERPEKMVCPLKADCDAVVGSKFGKFFGIPVEILGMLYYGLVAVLYALFIAVPSFATPLIIFLALTLTAVAFLFSLYLTFIQMFALRQWCTWCLISAGICTAIFAAALIGTEMSYIELLRDYRGVILAAHILGFILGVGGATITDIFFFKFLRDLKISHFESEILHTLSQVLWLGLAIGVVSGIGLYLPEAEALGQSAKFLVKVIVVGIIIVNGAFLNLYVSPRLIRISFGRPHHHEAGELRKERRIAFALGAVSIVSWYSAFFLGLLNSSPLSFWWLFSIYLGLIVIAVAVSQFEEYRLTHIGKRNSDM